jgi:STE24 endopeptidase
VVQLYPILIVALLLVGDVSSTADPIPLGRAALIAWAPPLLILLIAWALFAFSARRLAHGRTDALALADRVMRLASLALLASFAAAVLAGSWHDSIRYAIGADLVLLDELAAMLPPLVGILALWAFYYPIEKRVREAVLVRRLDQGEAVYPIPSRTRYVIQQARLHLLLLLLPLLAIIAAAETVRLLTTPWLTPDFRWIEDALVFTVGVGVFIVAPLLIRMVLSTTPLAGGEIRDDLEAICARHKVSVRQFLVWNTDGAVINAAVMGLFGRVRFVLMTDCLLQSLPQAHIQAVMAHEIGHVRRHHMPWLIGSLMALLPVALIITTLIAELALRIANPDELPPAEWIDGVVTASALILALLAFGWVSRRFERQADTFAVQHLSELQHEREQAAQADIPVDQSPTRPADDEPKVSVRAVLAMHNALEYVARLNGVRPRRPSWRHGSIAWRQHYLTSLVGRPVRKLSIDTVIRRIKIAIIVLLVSAPLLMMLLEWGLQ